MKKSIIRRNFIFSLVFGLGMGGVFPFYALLFAEFPTTLRLVVFSIGCVIAGIIVGLAAFYINNATIKKTARNLSSAVKGLRNNQIEENSIIIESADELGQLSTDMQSTVDNFRQVLSIAQTATGDAIEINNRLEENIHIIKNSLEVFSKTSRELDSTANAQDRKVDRMNEKFQLLEKATIMNVSGVIELYSYFHELNNILNRQSDSLTEIIEGLALVRDQIAGKTSQHAKEVKDITLRDLGQAMSDQSSSIIETSLSVFNDVGASLKEIENIAERTNILSINASIEAARYGNQGQGFRVIANSIKELSGEVQKTTTALSEQIFNGQEQLQNNTRSFRDVNSRYQEIVSQVYTSLEQLTKSHSSIQSISGKLDSTKGDMDQTLLDIKTNMESLKKIAEDNRNLLNGVIESSKSIRGSANGLLSEVNDLQKAEELSEKSLKQFKNQLSDLQRQIEKG